MNANQKAVKEDIVNIVKLGIQATGTPDLTDYEIEQVLQNIYPKTITNGAGQPIGDYPDGIPTQKQFDDFHETPQDYGEEGEWIIISKAINPKKAFELIIEKLDEYGMDDEYKPKSPDDLQVFDIGWGYDHDSYHYQDGGYWICSDTNKVSKRFEAWGVSTE